MSAVMLRRGMGAGPTFNDTGDGITPDNFQATCCTGLFGFQPDAAHLIRCNRFKASNESIFGDCVFGPCSSCAAAALSYGALPGATLPVQPPSIDTNPESPTYGQAINPCTGTLVATPQDAVDLQTCLAALQVAGQNAANRQTAGDILSAQCAAMKVQCAAKTFSSPNADCSDCVFDPFKVGSLIAIGFGLLVGAVILNRVLG